MKVLLVLTAFIGSVWGRILPDFIPVCKRSDPQIENCILKGVDSIRSRIINGIPEIKLPSLDPYYLPTLKVDKDMENLHVNIVIKNAVGRGARDFQVKNLKIQIDDDNNYKGQLTLLIKRLDVTADYEKLNAKILIFEDKGSSGKMEGNFTDIKAEVSATAKAVLKDGVRHLQIQDLKTDVKLGNGQVKLHDSKGGAIGDLATAFFNSDPHAVLNLLLPIVSEVVTATVKKIVGDLSATMPLDELVEP